MKEILVILSVIAAALLGYVLLSKTGQPVIFCIVAAVACGYGMLLLERKYLDKSALSRGLDSLIDIEDIYKSLKHIF